jgi:hypothetical protein
MALEKYTGKSASTDISVGGTAMPGWQEIVITENGRPLPTPKDVTDAEDTVYTFVDDPLGGETAPSSEVTVRGLLSVTDHQDTGGWLALVKGTAYAIIVTSKSGGDEWTQADMVLKDFTTGDEVRNAIPFTARFAHATLAGAWGTDS